MRTRLQRISETAWIRYGIHVEARMATIMPLLLVVVVVLIAGYEAWALWNKHPGDTISEIMWRATLQTPLVPLVFGFLAAHFFWPANTTDKPLMALLWGLLMGRLFFTR